MSKRHLRGGGDSICRLVGDEGRSARSDHQRDQSPSLPNTTDKSIKNKNANTHKSALIIFASLLWQYLQSCGEQPAISKSEIRCLIVCSQLSMLSEESEEGSEWVTPL